VCQFVTLVHVRRGGRSPTVRGLAGPAEGDNGRWLPSPTRRAMSHAGLPAAARATIDDGRIVITHHPILVYMERLYRESKWQCRMTAQPSFRRPDR
jgi:hypothetical protein